MKHIKFPKEVKETMCDKNDGLPVQTALRVNVYSIMERAIEEGIDYGWSRAYKYTDTPDEDAIKNSIRNEIMNSITEVFNFD